MVSVVGVDYNTRCYKFSIDTESDLSLLPKYGVEGKGKLRTISSCCPGSMARCTKGGIYILNGDSNEWILYSSGGSGGNSGGGGSELPDGYEIATEQDVKDLFGM